MTIYVVYLNYGYGERSAPKAAFTSYERAERYVQIHEHGSQDAEIEELTLDYEE